MHKKRAENWVVVNGIATVTIGDEVSTLKEGEATYIDIGVVHSLENRTIKCSKLSKFRMEFISEKMILYVLMMHMEETKDIVSFFIIN